MMSMIIVFSAQGIFFCHACMVDILSLMSFCGMWHEVDVYCMWQLYMAEG